MIKSYKPRVPRKFIGGYRPRVDGLAKASGKAEFVDDIALQIRFPNMLHARILRSPYAHARIKRLDTTRAEQLPGVKGILTFKNPEIASSKATSAGWTDGVDTVPYARMLWSRFKDRYVLSDHVCWVGDEAGVLVAAETEQIADEALRLLDIEWEVLPFVLDPIEAMKPDAPVIHPDITTNANVLPSDPVGGNDVFIDKGNVDKAFIEADEVIEVSTTYHNASQGALDNWCCLAEWKSDQLTVWSNSYEADQTRMHLSEMLGVSLNKVRVISPFVGGQFGRGDTGDQPFFIFTAMMSKKIGRPVKFKHTRLESFHDSRQPAIFDCKMGAKKDGTITSMYLKAIGNAGAYADHTMFALKFAPAEVAETCFAHIPNLRMQSYGVYTNMLPACMMRGVGNNQVNLILGLAIDAMAEKLDMDPLELALKNFGHEWSTLPDKSLQAVLKEGAERIGWADRHKPGQGPTYEGTKKRGVGFSMHPGWHAAWQEKRRGHIQVGITLNPDCTVTLDAATVETGPGSNTCNVLGCAEALSFLGVKLEDIHMPSTVDTQTGSKDVVQTDSSASFLQSEVMTVAAKDIKRQILELAVSEFSTEEVGAEDLDIKDGRIFIKAEPQKGIGVREFLWKGDMAPIHAKASELPNSELTGIPFIAVFAEVEVDTATGQSKVLKLVVLNDCGTVMFASGAEAQQIGGQCMAVGESLTEEIVYDKATGMPLNFNWIDYKMPTLADFPAVEPVLLEVWKGAGEYGASGLGESVVTCGPRAIANAIYNAIGVRLDEIPIKPEKVLKALGKA